MQLELDLPDRTHRVPTEEGVKRTSRNTVKDTELEILEGTLHASSVEDNSLELRRLDSDREAGGEGS